jgi:hypothetical protein
MKGFIEALNEVSETVWAIVIILLGALVALVALVDKQDTATIISLATTIVGIGAMAFKGGK